MENGKIKDEDIHLLQRMLCSIIRGQLVLLNNTSSNKLDRTVNQDVNSVASSLAGLLQEAGELSWDFRSHAPEISEWKRPK